MDKVINVLYIFLGAFLTFLGTLFVESWKNNKDFKDAKRNIIIFLKLELRSQLKGFDKLKELLEQKNYYDLLTITRLSESVRDLLQNRRDSILLEDTELQEKYLEVLTDTNILFSGISGLETYYQDERKRILENIPVTKKNKPYPQIFENLKEFEKFISDKRREKLIEIMDLKRRMEDFIRDIEKLIKK